MLEIAKELTNLDRHEHFRVQLQYAFRSLHYFIELVGERYEVNILIRIFPQNVQLFFDLTKYLNIL